MRSWHGLKAGQVSKPWTNAVLQIMVIVYGVGGSFGEVEIVAKFGEWPGFAYFFLN